MHGLLLQSTTIDLTHKTTRANESITKMGYMCAKQVKDCPPVNMHGLLLQSTTIDLTHKTTRANESITKMMNDHCTVLIYVQNNPHVTTPTNKTKPYACFT